MIEQAIEFRCVPFGSKLEYSTHGVSFQYRRDMPGECVGYTRLHVTRDKTVDTLLVEDGNKSVRFEVTEELNGKCIGFTYVGDNCYVGICEADKAKATSSLNKILTLALVVAVVVVGAKELHVLPNFSKNAKQVATTSNDDTDIQTTQDTSVDERTKRKAGTGANVIESSKDTSVDVSDDTTSDSGVDEIDNSSDATENKKEDSVQSDSAEKYVPATSDYVSDSEDYDENYFGPVVCSTYYEDVTLNKKNKYFKIENINNSEITQKLKVKLKIDNKSYIFTLASGEEKKFNLYKYLAKGDHKVTIRQVMRSGSVKLFDETTHVTITVNKK